jgi:hypothetical protein
VCKCNKTCEDILKNKYFYNFKMFCRIHKTKIAFSSSGEGTLTAYSSKCYDYSEQSSEMKSDIFRVIFKS